MFNVYRKIINNLIPRPRAGPPLQPSARVVSPTAIPNTRKFLSLPAKSRCTDAAPQ